MGRIVIVAYAPRLDAVEGLIELVRGHVPTLRHLGLATDRPAYVLRGRDGVLVEIFEWTSEEAMGAAHENRTVLELWTRFGEICEYRTLASLPESHGQFAAFEPLMVT